jgi:hypothetical protein
MAGVCADIGPSGAKTVLGVEAGAPKQDLHDVFANCVFFAASRDSDVAVGITIYVGQGPTEGLFLSYGRAAGMVAVSGIDDQALADAKGMFSSRAAVQPDAR